MSVSMIRMNDSLNIIVFDVDGTLTPQRPASTAQFERVLLPGVAEKCAALREAGYTLVLCSNQGGARQGRSPRLTMGAVHGHLRWVTSEIGAAGYWFATAGARKKPAPAMLLEIAARFGVQPADMFFIGDADSDREAAIRAGCGFAWAGEYFAC